MSRAAIGSSAGSLRLACVASLIGLSLSASALELLVPAYFYPVGSGLTDWARMASSSSSVQLTAILNPGSGPGAAVDPTYTAVVSNLRSAGGKAVGYVNTDYGNRSWTDVKADIDAYRSMYQVDGFFLDVMASGADKQSYYKSIYDYVKGLDPSLRVIANPGTSFDESYLSDRVADTIVSFEGYGSDYASYVAPSWMSGYSASSFAHIVHTEALTSSMLADLVRAHAQNAGTVYVTDRVFSPADNLWNPYDALPSYWNEEVKAAAAVPEPLSLVGLAAGLAAIIARRRR